MSEPRGAAFFDLDRTLMSGSSGAQFGRAAFRSGMVSRRQMRDFAAAHDIDLDASWAAARRGATAHR